MCGQQLLAQVMYHIDSALYHILLHMSRRPCNLHRRGSVLHTCV